MSGRLDRLAVASGAALGAAIALPVALAAQLLTDEGSAVRGLSVLAVLAGLAAGAARAAGRQHLGTPLVHGLVTAVGTYVVVQLVGALARVARGEGLNPGLWFTSALLSAMAGLVGGLIGGRRRA